MAGHGWQFDVNFLRVSWTFAHFTFLSCQQKTPYKAANPLSSDFGRPSVGTGLACRGNASYHLPSSECVNWKKTRSKGKICLTFDKPLGCVSHFVNKHTASRSKTTNKNLKITVQKLRLPGYPSLHYKEGLSVTTFNMFPCFFLHPFFGCGTPRLAVCCPACSVVWELTFVEHWAQLGNTLRHRWTARELVGSEGRCKMFRNQKIHVGQVLDGVLPSKNVCIIRVSY